MIKKNSYIFICFGLSASLHAQAPFAEQSFKTSLPIWSRGSECGEVDVVITGEKLEQMEKNSFLLALKNCARLEKYQHINESESWILPSSSPFPITYDPIDLKINADIPIDDEVAQELFFSSNIKNRLGSEALYPATFGGVLNYRAEKTWSSTGLQGDSFNTYFDTFLNLNSLVLESQFNYLNGDSSGTGWFRGDTRLVKDFQKKEIRAQAGDVYPPSFGFMSGRGIGGLLVSTDFSLDPYSLPFPQGQGNFTLRSRSNVRTWINGVLVKDETLAAGNYDLRDIPLINGINNVLVETIDEFGEKRVYQFNLPTSIELLNKGRWKFSISSGVPFEDRLFKREYKKEQEYLTSGFVQYGLTRDLTLGTYAQQQDGFNLLGLEVAKATRFGNFFIGSASSKDQSDRAQAAQASWQLQKIGQGLFNSYTLILRHQLFATGFTTQDNSVTSSLKSRWQTSMTMPVREKFTLSLGAQLGKVRTPGASDRVGWDTTLNMRVLRNLNLSMFVSRIRNENRLWSDVAYAFLTWSFDGSGHLVNAFHDLNTNASRITAVKDNANRLYEPRIHANVEESEVRDTAEVDAFVPMPFADVGARVGVEKRQTPDKLLNKSSVRLASAITFAYNKGEWGAGLSRPVPNSFVLFKPSEEIAKQKVALRSTSPYNESASGPFGELTYTNLLPYQYREIQLDPSSLDEGTTLERERFVVYPYYRSAHLIPLRDKGNIIIEGYLLDQNKRPLKLLVGTINDKVFFTGPDGRFFIEGIEPGEHLLKIEKQAHELPIQISKDARGIKSLGSLTYPLENIR